jgi:hypothetical protein
MKVTDDRKLDSDRAYAALVEYGDDWADKDAAANLLEETKKSVLARIKNETESKSDAARETVALAHPDYRAHVDSMVEARRVANRAKVRYDSARVLAEMRRSEESTRRAEMTMR